MITKCPHCHKKFKAQDSWIGKRATCPKCLQKFMIEAYVRKSSPTKTPDSAAGPAAEAPTCARCGREIDPLEQTYEMNGARICQGCHARARAKQPPPIPDQQVPDRQAREKLDQMTKIAAYQLLKKGTRPGAIGAIIFGLIAVLMGGAMLSENPLNGFLIIIGIFLLTEGIVVLALPSPAGMILQGIGMWMVGIWNLGLTLLEMGAGQGWSIWGLLGISQMVWGSQSFAGYRRFAEGAEAASDASLAHEVELVVKDLLKAKAQSRRDIITFKFGAIAWKGYLGACYGTFSVQGGKDTQFLLRDDVSFTEKGKALLGKTLKVRICLDHKEMDGTISPEHMERFTSWKNAVS